jgi:hypothetical protein
LLYIETFKEKPLLLNFTILKINKSKKKKEIKMTDAEKAILPTADQDSEVIYL